MEEQRPFPASPQASEGQSTAVPDLSGIKREVNPHLWETMRRESATKDELSGRFAETVHHNGFTPQENTDLLRSLTDSEFTHDYTTAKGWSPSQVAMYESPCVKLGDGEDFYLSPRLSTLRLGVEMATVVSDDQGREVMQVPYPSFAPPVTPLERMVGVKVTQVGWYRFTPEQFTDLQRVVSRPAAQLPSQPPPPAA